VRQQLVGLAVLRHATAEQIRIALPIVEISHGISNPGILELFAR
jgi:hypothetical protein